MKKVKGMPITGATPEYSKSSQFLPNAADTSSDEQKFIAQAPTPFKSNQQVPQIPAGTGKRGAVPGPVQKPYANLQHKSPGAKALPSRGPVGQRKAINQNGAVNGRMGTRFPKKVGAYPKGFPAKRNASFYGE